MLMSGAGRARKGALLGGLSLRASTEGAAGRGEYIFDGERLLDFGRFLVAADAASAWKEGQQQEKSFRWAEKVLRAAAS